MSGADDRRSDMPIAGIRIGQRHRRELGDIASLARSIDELGLLHPVVVTPAGDLVAGERRLRAARQLGWESIPATIVDLDSIVRGEHAENTHRKDFTLSEAVAIAEALEPLERAAAAERQRIHGGTAPGRNTLANSATVLSGRALDRVGQAVGRSRDTLTKAKAVVDAAKAEPERYGGLRADMDRTGRAHGPYKRLQVLRQAEQLRAAPPPLPGRGPYQVIVADPPWPYEQRALDLSHRAAGPYPGMPIEDICKLAVPSIVADDAILWLWTTNFHMRHAFTVLDSWGFEPRTILTWNKDHFGFGDWLRNQTEHALFAVRGRPIVTLTNESTRLDAPVGAHSAKPEAFFRLVERLCPASRYVELFARRRREGWDSWGNEVDSSPGPALADSSEGAADNDWLEQDLAGSYYAAVEEIGKRVRAGEPIPDYLRSKRAGGAT